MRFTRRPSFSLIAILALTACGGSEATLEDSDDSVVGALPPCSAAFKANLLASAAGEVAQVRGGHCQVDFAATDVLRPLRIQGAGASGLRINCNGARIAPKAGSTITTMIQVSPLAEAAVVEAEMLKAYEAGHGAPVAPYGVSRPEDVTIDGCQLSGSVLLGAVGGNARPLSSRSQLDTSSTPHILRARQLAVRGIHLSHLKIDAPPALHIGNLVFFQQGVSDSSLSDSTLTGESSSTTMYLAPEGTGNVIERNTFNVAHTAGNEREILAIDGSSNNIIRGNSFRHVENGGIYVYRNCGETGGTRHQGPSGNQIFDNDFFYMRSVSAAIWVGRRAIVPSLNTSDSFLSFLDIPDTYCHLDEKPLTITLVNGTQKTLARSKAKLGSAADTHEIPVHWNGFTVAHLDVNHDAATNNAIHDNALLNYGLLHQVEDGIPVPPVYRRIDRLSDAVKYPGSSKKDAAIKFSGANVEVTNTQARNSNLTYPAASCRPSPPPVTIGGVTRRGSFDPATGVCLLLPR